MMKRLVVLLIFSASVLFGNSLPEELKEIFVRTVSSLKPEESYVQWAKETARDALQDRIDAKQYFVLVDRSPRQSIMVGLYCPETAEIKIIGWDKVSTGDPNQPGRFPTPAGVFTNTTSIIGWRSTGIPNENGWISYGPAGLRVWDFGWQITDNGRSIRLALHATDPVLGQSLLGQPASHGCIRISEKMNRFLDYYGILDYDYEINPENPWVKWLLLDEREAVLYSGQHLIVAEYGT